MAIEIEVHTENGSAFGYVVSTSESNILNYLSQHTDLAKQINNILAKRFDRVALLRNMYVDEDARGCGEGSDLVMQFMSEAELHGAQMIMLVSDAEEEQLEGFDLVTFYEGFDFYPSITTSSGMLMFSDEELADVVIKTKNREKEPELLS